MDGETDEMTITLLNNVQSDPNSPLYSAKSFEELNL
jgi:hypothetical protein